jgi:hypothetical protein
MSESELLKATNEILVNALVQIKYQPFAYYTLIRPEPLSSAPSISLRDYVSTVLKDAEVLSRRLADVSAHR